MRRYSLAARRLVACTDLHARRLRWPWRPARRRSWSRMVKAPTTASRSSPGHEPSPSTDFSAVKASGWSSMRRSLNSPPTFRTRPARVRALPGRARPFHRPAELRDLRAHLGSLITRGLPSEDSRGSSSSSSSDVADMTAIARLTVRGHHAYGQRQLTPYPFLVTGRALNNSKFGGGCIDYGATAVRLPMARRRHQRRRSGRRLSRTGDHGQIATSQGRRRRLRASPTRHPE